ncbi:ribosome biogenesis GTPase Der [Candidatus Atribacteria bacterium RBG_19FT_COMBO_35_14]|uniref:GTPase Der n=1 Tax=Candidatus Sediminicultor quintus TaxID=1797291 RepID=A0A1F5A6P6_9BACT|nr:MAG: ribosome biogenesis GTPase Der [Candidatus Atribacteria bacterium RBG_19FT_COMBO_35_14]
MRKPIVAIIGRINVGKSTLFNRITKKRTAIVENEPGITRDRIYAECEWKGKQFTLVDTGGVDFIKREELQKKITVQIELAIEEADLIILLVDVKEGINPDDFKVAKAIREKNKSSILVANKGDVKGSELKLYEFYELGFGDPYIISAEHGLNIDDLLDRIISYISEIKIESEEEENLIKVSIIGRPNVGKSSLLNRILGEDRIIVSEHPGTTRDAIEIIFKHNSLKLMFIDTAGLRGKAKPKEDVEYYSTLRTFTAVHNSDIVLLILDSTQGVSMQDKKIANYVQKERKACIIILNKFDLIKDNIDRKLFIDEIRYELSFLKKSPIIMTSAITGYNMDKIISKIKEVALQYSKKIPTSAINVFIREVISKNPPKYVVGNTLKIKYATQTGIKPPTFLLFVNNPKLMYTSYHKYLENKFYETFGFEGSPVVIDLARKSEERETV